MNILLLTYETNINSQSKQMTNEFIKILNLNKISFETKYISIHDASSLENKIVPQILIVTDAGICKFTLDFNNFNFLNENKLLNLFFYTDLTIEDRNNILNFNYINSSKDNDNKEYYKSQSLNYFKEIQKLNITIKEQNKIIETNKKNTDILNEIETLHQTIDTLETELKIKDDLISEQKITYENLLIDFKSKVDAITEINLLNQNISKTNLELDNQNTNNLKIISKLKDDINIFEKQILVLNNDLSINKTKYSNLFINTYELSKKNELQFIESFKTLSNL